MGAADPLVAELGLIGTGWAALAWAGLIGVAGWMRAELASPGPLRFRAPSPALGLRSVICCPPGLVPACIRNCEDSRGPKPPDKVVRNDWWGRLRGAIFNRYHPQPRSLIENFGKFCNLDGVRRGT